VLWLSRYSWVYFCRHHTIAVCLILTPLIVLLALDRVVPFQFDYGVITPGDAQPGGQVAVEWHGRAVRACEGVVYRHIVDASGVAWGYEHSSDLKARLEFGQSIRRPFTLPENIAVGPATYDTYSCFRCDFTQAWWPLCSRSPTIRFNVVARS
jgi:hypothetical protein